MFSNNDDILKIRFYYEPKPYWQYWFNESPYLILDIFGNFILNKYNILCVFDDRKSVVEMWKKLGLYVFDCNYRGVDF